LAGGALFGGLSAFGLNKPRSDQPEDFDAIIPLSIVTARGPPSMREPMDA
jgi:hypothetical protein